MAKYIDHYNNVRLNSAIGHVAAKAKLEGRVQQILKEWDEKLEAAREAGRIKRQKQKAAGKAKLTKVIKMISYYWLTQLNRFFDSSWS